MKFENKIKQKLYDKFIETMQLLTEDAFENEDVYKSMGINKEQYINDKINMINRLKNKND